MRMNDNSNRPVILAFFLFAAYVVTISAVTSPTPYPSITPLDVSKIDFSKFEDEEIAKTEAHRDELRSKVRDSLESQAAVVDDQGSTLKDVKTANADTKKNVDNYVATCEERIREGNAAIVALAKQVKRHHRAQWILCALWLAVVGLVVTKLPLVAKAYGLYVGAALLIGGTIFIWTVL